MKPYSLKGALLPIILSILLPDIGDETAMVPDSKSKLEKRLDKLINALHEINENEPKRKQFSEEGLFERLDRFIEELRKINEK